MANDERSKKSEEGRNQGGNSDLHRRIAALEAEVARLKSPVITCKFCEGDGVEPDPATGGTTKAVDDNGHYVLCRVCKGLCKVRVL